MATLMDNIPNTSARDQYHRGLVVLGWLSLVTQLIKNLPAMQENLA